MENHSFKSVAFGGFDKQDVVRYLEQASEKAAAAQRELEAENDELRRRAEEQAERLGQLEERVAGLTEERDRLREELEAEIAALRPDAEAYARFRERLGTIECEARKRAEDMETEAAAQTRRTLEEFRSRYQRLMSAFESAAGHAGGELRKIEVTLSQLPRALDQTGADLNELAARLEKGKRPEKKN